MIETEQRDQVTILRLAHGKASALDVELLEAFVGELTRIRSSDTRAVVVTGTGTIFSAGVDLFRLTDGGAAYIDRFLPLLDDALLALFELPLPVVAAINGHAIAGGCIIAQACDHRIMAEGSGRIGIPELLVGVPLPPVPFEIVRFAVPGRYLQRLAESGATFVPHEGLHHGLVDEVVEPQRLMDRALEVATSLGSIPSRVFAITKKQIRQPSMDRLAAVSPELRDEVANVWRDPETHEHIKAYLARTVRK
jgi:enoyl-CoA hydratase